MGMNPLSEGHARLVFHHDNGYVVARWSARRVWGSGCACCAAQSPLAARQPTPPQNAPRRRGAPALQLPRHPPVPPLPLHRWRPPLQLDRCAQRPPGVPHAPEHLRSRPAQDGEDGDEGSDEGNEKYPVN